MENDKENREAPPPPNVLSKLHLIAMTDCPPSLFGHRVKFPEEHAFHSSEVQTVDELIRTGISENFRIGFKVVGRNTLWIKPEANLPDADHDIPIALLSSEINWMNKSVSKFHAESAARGQVQDLFSEKFLLASLEEGIIKNLNNYRLLPTRFEKYDANDILHGRRKWSDLTLLPQTVKAKVARTRTPRSTKYQFENYQAGDIAMLVGPTSPDSGTGTGTGTGTESSEQHQTFDSIKSRFPPVPLFVATNDNANTSTWTDHSYGSSVSSASTQPLDSAKSSNYYTG